MAKETVHLIQAYIAGRGKQLKAEPQIGCANAAEALRRPSGWRRCASA